MKKSIFLLLFLTACVSSQPYGDTLQGWVGQSEGALEQAWGQPNNVFYLTPDEKVVTFLQVDASAIGDDNTPYSNEFAYDSYSNPTFGDPQYTAEYCKTSFTILNGQVVDYTFNGDDCVVPY